jgi:glycosyltransferase involved in cell wall biosynthesis
MRVVHVTPYFPPAFQYGGPPRTIFGLCRALQCAGVEVEVITTTANGANDLPASPPEGDRYEGVPVRYLPRAFPKRFFGAALHAPIEAALLRADICHVHGMWNAPEWAASRLAMARRVPYVLSPRGMLHGAARRRGRMRKAVAWALLEHRSVAGAARLHATSNGEALVLSQHASRDRIVVVPNGVDVDAARRSPSVRARLGIPAAAPVIAFVGRVHPIKRLDLLAAAVAILRRTHPTAHLIIAGPDEHGCLAMLAPRLAPLGAAAHCIGEATDAEKWALLADSTALVLCSDSENFGVSVVEAMAAGVPVVVARTCPWEIVERERCGLWVDQNAEAIASALSSLIAHPERARAMGARGAALARRAYSWAAIGRDMARCYVDILSAGCTRTSCPPHER